jgi:hypothetical protein
MISDRRGTRFAAFLMEGYTPDPEQLGWLTPVTKFIEGLTAP